LLIQLRESRRKVTERWNKRREKKKRNNILQIPENDRGGNSRRKVGSVSVTNYGGAAP